MWDVHNCLRLYFVCSALLAPVGQMHRAVWCWFLQVPTVLHAGMSIWHILHPVFLRVPSLHHSLQNVLFINKMYVLRQRLLFTGLNLRASLLIQPDIRQHNIERVRNMPKPVLNVPGRQLNFCKMHKLHDRLPVHCGEVRFQLPH